MLYLFSFLPSFPHQHLDKIITNIHIALIMPLVLYSFWDINMRGPPYVYATWTTQLHHFSVSPLLLRLWPSLGFSLSISAYNRPRPTGFYILACLSTFRVFLTAGPLLADQGLPSVNGSRCLLNCFSIKIISQDLTGARRIWIFLDAQLLPHTLSGPLASGRQIMTPPESCLSIPHINFSYDPKLIAYSWLLSLGCGHFWHSATTK